LITVILVSIACGIAANEFCEFGPWCARKLVRWSAFRRYPNPERAEIRAEELTALIDDRPGNLFKLFTAVSFAGAAVIVSVRRAATRESDASAGSTPAISAISHEEVLNRVYSYVDGQMSGEDYENFRQHLDECAPCLREYGLEEAVKRLVQKRIGCEPVTTELQAKVLVRIRAVREVINLTR
jgi:mycothiol system anti-sigma-R factor